MPLGNLGTNIRITAGTPGGSGSFPFAGSWSSTGFGWQTQNGSLITSEVGATSKQTIGTVGTNKIEAIGSVTYFGNQSFIIVLDSAPSGWNQIQVTPDGGATTTYALADADLHINPQFSDTNAYTLLWERGHLDFTNGISGVCVFNDGVQPNNYTWTAATGNPHPGAWQAAAADNVGNVLGVYSGNPILVYRSTNGGLSFSLAASIADGGNAGTVVWDGTRFVLASTSGTVYTSTDHGSTWSSVGTFPNGHLAGSGAGDGAGNTDLVDAQGIDTAYYNGTYHNGANMPTTTGSGFFGIAWDAAQAKFFVMGSQSAGVGHVFLGSSPVSWVDKGAMNRASDQFMWAASWNNGTQGQSACISQSRSSVFMVAQNANSFMLQLQKEQTVGAGDTFGSGSLCNDGAGNWFYFDDLGVGAASADGIFWGGQSPPFATNDYGIMSVYDKQHAAFIVFGGNGGGIFTTAVQSGIQISPLNPTVALGGSIPFTETGDDGNGVTWRVNGVVGGSAANGTINNFGVYLAPSQAQFAADNGPYTVTVSVENTDNPAQISSTTVTFIIPTINAQGTFRGPSAFRPVSLSNVGQILPRIYAPGENITVKSQS